MHGRKLRVVKDVDQAHRKLCIGQLASYGRSTCLLQTRDTGFDGCHVYVLLVWLLIVGVFVHHWEGTRPAQYHGDDGRNISPENMGSLPAYARS